MAESLNEALMRRAIRLSRKGFTMPNPHVGCVIVRDGQVVGEGWHAYAGGPHAEAAALAQAGDCAKGADVFVTMEPCNHHGRTPPCSQALIGAGVRRVFVAVPDPNPVAAGGAEVLRNAEIEVKVGLLEVEARDANHAWLTAMNQKRPFLTLKAAITLDAKIARLDGSSKWITGEAARRDAHRLRAEMGCVVVGVNTVLADDPQLTARIPGVRNQPLRVVLDPRSRLTGDERVFHGDETVWVREEISPVALLDRLWERGVRGVLVEGGGETLRRFMASGVANRLCLYVGPKVFGEGVGWLGSGLDLPANMDLKLENLRRYGQDFRAEYEIMSKI